MTIFYTLLFKFATLFSIINAGGLSPTGWSVYRVSNILTALEESSSGCLGPYDASFPTTQKTYGGSFPPHWSLSVDVYAWQLRTWDGGDYVALVLDSVVRETAYKIDSSALDFLGGASTNVDGLKIFHVNITHTAPSVTLRMDANLDQSYPDEWLCFNNIRLWIDTCDETCASCNGPAPNQCTGCPVGATLSGGTCKCAGSQFGNNNACVTCPAGTWGDPNLKKCVPACLAGSNNCISCLDERHCGACSGGMVSYLGDCIATCPFFYENVGGICKYLEDTFTRGSTIYAGLDKIINKSDESSFSFPYTTDYNLQQKFYVCSNGDRMLGGFDGAGYGNPIQYNPGTVPYHYRVRIKVMITYLDSWDSEFMYVNVSGATVISDQRSLAMAPTNYCGTTTVGWNDQRVAYDVTFNHSGNTLPVSFETNLAEGTTNESFGISHLIIIIDECPNQLCTTCNATVCLTCVPGAFLNNSDICVNPCPNGQFGNTTTGRCEACNYKCTTCSGSATNCTSCPPERGAATPPNCDCVAGQYDNSPNPTCKQCSYKCTTCVTSAGNCTDCAGNRPDTGIPTCACPAGTYDDGTNGVCPACDFVCATCSGSSSNCLTCKGNRIRAPKCECPEGTFDDGVSLNCQTCNPKCRTCTGNANNCTSCSSNRVMPTCDCPSTHYDDGTVICKVCSYQCVTCTGSATNCTSCAGNRLPQTPTCPCPPDYNEAGYANCVVCDPKCDQCSSVDKNCTSCSGNRSQNPPFCTCPIGTYETNLANCPSCSYKCSSCDITDTNCTACSHVSRTTTPTCNCKDGYYEKNSIDCGVCPKKCITCKSAVECLTCSANRWNPPECSCKDGYYEDANGDCQPCNSFCTRCIGPASTQCDTCSGNRIDYPTCRCPLGTYDSGQPTCPTCNVACTQCSGSTTNDCITCSGNKTYDSVLKKCICPANTLDLGTGYFCAQCNPLCNGCSGTANTCTTCAGNRIGLPSCSQCPDGTYDYGGVQCAQCNKNICSTCTQSSTNCSTCATGRVNAPTCTCAIGTYDTGITCEKCDKMCSSCDKTSKNCTVCIAGRSDPPNCTCDNGTYDDGVNIACQTCKNQCVTCTGENTCTQCRGDRMSAPSCVCPVGTFDDGLSQDCRKCDFQCTSCSGSSSNCTSCKGNRINYPQCVCPVGFFETGQDDCQVCDKQCGSCSNFSENCLSCSGIRINPPECSCPASTYFDQVKNDCINCYKTCLSCNGAQSTQCIQCLQGFVMRDSECKGPVGTYIDINTNSIKACSSTCQECENSDSFCIKCDSSKYRKISMNKCICIDGYTENASKICEVIVKPVVNKCGIENNAFGILSSSECECEEGYYLQISTGKCLACSLSNYIQCSPFNEILGKKCTSDKCLDCVDGYTYTQDGKCFKIITDQSPEILFSIFSFITLGFGITIGVICFLKWQYKQMKATGFQKLEKPRQNNNNNNNNGKKKIIMDQPYQVIQYV